MSYRWSLLTGWRSRDTGAVVVLGLTVAFLTGTVLVASAAGAQVVGMAAEYDTGGTVEYVDGPVPDANTATGTVLPATTVTVTTAGQQRESVTAVALRSPLSVPGPGGPSTIQPVERGAATDATSPGERVTLRGPTGSATVTAAPAGGLLSPAWYQVNGTTLERLGSTGAFVVTPPTDGTALPDRGAPIRGALTFFLVGSRQLATLLRLVALGAGALVAVTVYSVTRIAVRDRQRAIRVARATGAPPRHVVAVFAARGAGIALAGTALGYAVGVVLLNLVVNVAVFAGVPTTLELAVSPQAASILGPAYAAVVGLGAIGGAVASLGVARAPPAAVGRPAASDAAGRPTDDGTSASATRHSVVTPTVLGWRPLVPMTVALTVFVALSVVLMSGAGAVGPLVDGGGQTITEPDAVHPVASTVPGAYADVLRSSGTAASGELLAFSVVDGEPVLTRGADFEAFASISAVGLVDGRAPAGRSEAVVGADLADRLDVAPGDTVTLGGSTEPAVARVTVVGVFSGPGAVDDQLVVSLPTARHLTGKPPGAVQFVRTAGMTDAAATDAGAVVTGIEAPTRVVAGENVTVTATVVAVDATSTVEVGASLGDRQHRRTVEVRPFEQRQVSFTFRAPEPGEYTLRVGDRNHTVVSQSPDQLMVRGLPSSVPAGTSPLITVSTVGGDPVAGATVTVGDRHVETGADGTVRLPVGAAGSTVIEIHAGNRTRREPLTVSEAADPGLVATITVSPERPTVLSPPTVGVELSNPWNRTVTRDVRVVAGESRRSRTISLDPGERTGFEFAIARQPPGQFAVVVATERGQIADRTVTVTGDDRLAAALATGGVDRGGSAVGRAVATAFGNLRLLVGALLAVAAVTVVGSVAASLASGVRARQRTLGIYRSTGASPGRIRRLIVADAVRIGVVATALGGTVGVVAARGLAAAGVLTLYGVTVRVRPSAATLAVLVSASLLLVALGGLVAARGAIRPAPARLLDDGSAEVSRDD